MEDNNKILVCIDGSYWLYFTVFGAVAEFQRSEPSLASIWIKPVEECDQSNLPNLLNCEEFKVILKKMTMKRLETVEWIVKSNFQDEVDMSSGIDFLFAMDDRVSYSFRKKLYPEYKAQRALVKKSFQVQVLKDYIVNVLFKDLNVEDDYNYKLVKVEGAEGDDVIATAYKSLKTKYLDVVLIASDHDYLQLDGLRVFNLFGQEAKREIAEEEVTASDYLLGKILMGDKSDNIKQVFSRCGPKTALKLLRDKDSLKTMLKESQDASSRYLLNKKIISFSSIPEDLENAISEKLNRALIYDGNQAINEVSIDLKDFMML